MDKATIELTKEEAEIIEKFLQSTPVTGTISQLPKVLVLANGILQKLYAAFAVPDESSASLPVELVQTAQSRNHKHRRH